MPQYRKKPVVIEAFQWLGQDSHKDAPAWFTEARQSGIILRARNTLEIKTREGRMKARPTDWIIRGVRDELYPCKPDIFADTYERVEDESQ